MNSQSTLQEQLLQGISFELPPEPPVVSVCPIAQAFANWCEELVKPVREHPTEITVNVALLHVQDQFFARHESTGKHQHDYDQSDLTDNDNCLFEVYQSYFLELRAMRWKVNPPLIREPPAPPPPPQFSGTTLSDLIGNGG